MLDGDRPLTSTRTELGGARRPVRHMRVFSLTDGEGHQELVRAPRARIGREPSSDFVIADTAVSRAHCEIVADDHGYRLIDLDSHNGTTVDGVRARDVYLRDGAVIGVGRAQLAFRAATEEAELEASDHDRFEGLVGASLPMRELYAQIARVAPTSSSVLVLGETGTGKELVARAIHDRSARAEGPFIVFDCAAISPHLVEAELFGHEAGAFTGAHERRDGLLKRADGGTLFLDELGELPLELQPKLLRAIEQREVRRVGGTRSEKVDVRFVAATHRDLVRDMNTGGFRADLYYRLAVFELRLPTLRSRREDIPMLVEHFAAGRAIAPELVGEMGSRPWRGNVRQLRNFVERVLVTGDATPDPEVTRAPDTPTLTPDLDRPFAEQRTALLQAFELAYLESQLERCDGNISAASRASGLERMYFKRMLKRARGG